MSVKVPDEKGVKLKPAGTPTDLVYGGLKIHHGKHHGKDVPQGIVHDKTGPADFSKRLVTGLLRVSNRF